jgi:peptide/nickel transport system permease protein
MVGGVAGRPERRIAALLLGRAASVLATLAGATALVLALLWAAPGDPIALIPNGEELRPVLAREWDLDRPLPVRYVSWLSRAATGDLGTSLSYRTGAPVTAVIAGPAVRSLTWVAAAMALALAGGTVLGWFTAGKRAPARTLIHAISIAPLFLLAHLAIAGINAATWQLIGSGWIARPGWFALPDQDSAVRTALAIALLAVGSGALADVHAEIEDSLVRIRKSGYVDAARARGAPVWPHVLRNLVPPLAAIATSRAAFFVGGLVVLEKVLLLNGVGAILWEAALQRDYNVALGITVVLATAVVAVRLVGDATRIAVDPRLADAR